MQKLIENIRRETAQQLDIADLPIWIAEQIEEKLSNPPGEEKRDILEELLLRLHEFDAFADTGCFKDGYDATDLQNTLKKLG